MKLKLFELAINKGIKKGDKIYAEFSDGSKYCKFYHLDGMYSYCVTEKGGVVHLHTATEIEIKDGKFFINL